MAVVGAATGLVMLVNPDVRRGVLSEGSVGNILRNFRSPFRRVLEGTRADRDPFVTNYVGHPVSWGMLGLYLRERGYSRGGSLLFSQVHSVAWEFVIEGSFQPPSGKDLVTNLVSSSVAIYMLYELVGGRGRAAGEEPPRVSLLLRPPALPELPGDRRPVPGPGPDGGLTVGLAVSL